MSSQKTENVSIPAMITLTINRRIQGKYTFYDTTLVNTRINLSKKLVAVLEKHDLLHSTATVPGEIAQYLRLTAQQATKDGKTYTNLYLTLSKDFPETIDEKPAEADENLPF